MLNFLIRKTNGLYKENAKILHSVNFKGKNIEGLIIFINICISTQIPFFIEDKNTNLK